MLNSLFTQLRCGTKWYENIPYRLVLACVLLIVVVAGVLLPNQHAYAQTVASGEMTITVAVGLDTTARIGYWTPVQITLHNEGGAFRGKVSLRTFSGVPRFAFAPNVLSQQPFEQAVAVAQGATQQFTMYIPFNVGTFNPRGVVANVIDTHGNVVAAEQARVYTLNYGDVLVGILSDTNTGFAPLSTLSLPTLSSSVITASLDASTFPTDVAVLNNLDVLIVSNFDTKTLHAQQLAALLTWINQGGALIEMGGSTGQRTLAGLPAQLAPVMLQRSGSVAAGMHLLPDEQPTIHDTVKAAVTISIGTLRPTVPAATSQRATVLSMGATPMFVETALGSGSVCYLAYDLTEEPLASWSGVSTLWSHILLRALGDQALISGTTPHYISGPGQLIARGGLFAMLQPGSFSYWTLLLVFLSYLFVLGPVCLILLRRYKKAQLVWRVLLSSIVLFSLLSYGLALYQRGASLLDTSISMIQLDQASPMAHITTYMGVYVPDQGDYQIRIPQTGSLPLAQTLTSTQWFSNTNNPDGDPSASVLYGPHTTMLNIYGAGLWTLHTLIAEHDQQLHGTIQTQLTLRNRQLIGSITNTLPTALSDVYILMPHSFVAIGHLAAGETQHVRLPLQDFSQLATTTQASQIAQYNGLPAAYFPYNNGQQPQTETQRHIALLTALDGQGDTFVPCNGSCSLHTIVHKLNIITPTLNVPTTRLYNGSDPLLLPNASATILAWADQPLDGTNEITINGIYPHGLHDNLLQVPCSLTIATPAQALPDTFTGHVIATQGSGASLVFPDVYTLPASSGMTFEFTLPDSTIAQLTGLRVSAPHYVYKESPPSFIQPTSTLLQAKIYNWHSSAWEPLDLAASVNQVQAQAYVGPNGRILVQLTNQSTASDILFVSKPSLALL